MPAPICGLRQERLRLCEVLLLRLGCLTYTIWRQEPEALAAEEFALACRVDSLRAAHAFDSWRVGISRLVDTLAPCCFGFSLPRGLLLIRFRTSFRSSWRAAGRMRCLSLRRRICCWRSLACRRSLLPLELDGGWAFWGNILVAVMLAVAGNALLVVALRTSDLSVAGADPARINR